MIKNFTAFFSICLMSLALAACGDDAPKSAGPAPTVGVYTMKSEALDLTMDLPGRTVASRVAEVRPQVNGIIQKRLFEEGATVEAGMALYQIDEAVYKAAYDKALAHLQNAERAAARQETLKNKQSLSAQDYEDALYAWRQAQADAELARLNLEYCRVTAPLSGRIGRSNITEGALVTNGQPQSLAVIQQLDPIYVDLTPAVAKLLKSDAADSSASFLQGAEVALTLEDGSAYPLTGRVKFLDNSVDQGTGSVTMRAEFSNPDGKLLPGMFVRARVVEASLSEAFLVPQQALTRNAQGQAQVWVVDGEGVAAKRDVTAGRSVGNTWLISGGLENGDRVVTEGLQRLAQGLQVNIREAENVSVKLAFSKGKAPANEAMAAQRAAGLTASAKTSL